MNLVIDFYPLFGCYLEGARGGYLGFSAPQVCRLKLPLDKKEHMFYYLLRTRVLHKNFHILFLPSKEVPLC